MPAAFPSVLSVSSVVIIWPVPNGQQPNLPIRLMRPIEHPADALPPGQRPGTIPSRQRSTTAITHAHAHAHARVLVLEKHPMPIPKPDAALGPQLWNSVVECEYAYDARDHVMAQG